ncbi:MAG: hypothetical protein H7328_12220 [Bdellovibrio sp.]|nr:hypothetical protein [Bdellovibrio sp.]
MITMIRIFSFLLLTTPAGAAFQKMGGHAVVCETRNQRIDYSMLAYEYRPMVLVSANTSLDLEFETLMKRLDMYNPTRADRFRQYWKDFSTNTVMATGIELVSTEKNSNLDPQCKIRKVLAQIETPRPHEKEFLLDLDLWQTFSPHTQAYVLLETFFYKEIFAQPTVPDKASLSKLREVLYYTYTNQPSLGAYFQFYYMRQLGLEKLDVNGVEVYAQKIKGFLPGGTDEFGGGPIKAHLVSVKSMLKMDGQFVKIRVCNFKQPSWSSDLMLDYYKYNDWIIYGFCLAENKEFKVAGTELSIACLGDALSNEVGKTFFHEFDKILKLKSCLVDKGTRISADKILETKSYVEWDQQGGVVSIDSAVGSF